VISVASGLVFVEFGIHLVVGAMVYRIATERELPEGGPFQQGKPLRSRGSFFDAVADCCDAAISAPASSSRCIPPVRCSPWSGPDFSRDSQTSGVDPAHKIALIADDQELNHSHEYFVLLGRLHGINVRHFSRRAVGTAMVSGARNETRKLLTHMTSILVFDANSVSRRFVAALLRNHGKLRCANVGERG